MKTTQFRWNSTSGWSADWSREDHAPQLILLFGGTNVLQSGDAWRELRENWPDAHVMGCSTAGEICDVEVSDDGLVATLLEFEHTRTELQSVTLETSSDSRSRGIELGQALTADDLRHVFVLSEGLNVNGSELVDGLTSALPEGVAVTGGLSGDGARFEETLVLNDGVAQRNTVVALGLFGEQLKVGYASLGGWDQFGPERVVTRSKGNVLFELDGKSALELYKNYLGKHADGLPGTGLLFPLSVRQGDQRALVRTILGVDEEAQSLIFAGDIPVGSHARLMKANFERLVDGAHDAAAASVKALDSEPAELAILISCVGRKMVLKQRVEEELEAVRSVLGPAATLAGFYSYGELSPFDVGSPCALHNQTMTVTTFRESA